MKPFLFLVIFSLLIGSINAQNHQDLVKIGDELVIGKPSGVIYKNINVTRKNFIIKRGGIANISTLENSVVTVTKISHSDNPIITFKKSNGRKFFRVYKTLTAELNGAINTGEMALYTR
ncbi:hypothetical protein [Flagellimonas eckloniae]|uniref:Dihydroorotase n=1 Tax=Flagellimonas eckloniae TaxID=346185 RepID=A0A0N8WGA3_9FLAO|nr:hypothetical protein [Allomuricauda eckloniae]KQC30939.1 hypothetical protein AAY42_14340 [Allomuricauda eckloniae]